MLTFNFFLITLNHGTNYCTPKDVRFLLPFIKNLIYNVNLSITIKTNFKLYNFQEKLITAYDQYNRKY